MSNAENFFVQVKVDHHQLISDLRIEGQVQNKGLLVGFTIHQAAEPLEPQKVHHFGKRQLGRVHSCFGKLILNNHLFLDNKKLCEALSLERADAGHEEAASTGRCSFFNNQNIFFIS